MSLDFFIGLVHCTVDGIDVFDFGLLCQDNGPVFTVGRRAGHNTQFADNGHRAGPVHLTEKLCPFFLLDIQRHSGERSGKRDQTVGDLQWVRDT